MVTNVGRQEVGRLQERGAQLVEVLEESQYRQAHLPGAVHIPAWELTRERSDELQRDRPVILYCYDTQ